MGDSLTIGTPLIGVVAKSPITLALGAFCVASSPWKLAAQGPSGMDPGQPLLPDVPSELPSLLSIIGAGFAACIRFAFSRGPGLCSVLLLNHRPVQLIQLHGPRS